MKSQIAMFELPDIEEEPVIEFRSIQPIWTENKARLIQRYLKLFIHITKHGTYIDGFAGPQYLDKIDAWSAKLVLQIELKWLGRFLLCDNSLEKYAHLNELRRSQPPNKKGDRRREIKLWNADFNQIVVQMLDAGSIDENTAAFCLLDQHTFECRWETLVRLAEYKKQRKIELFYFLAVGWLGRAIHAQKDEKVLDAWWGRSDWQNLQGSKEASISSAMVSRFKDELDYRYVYSWPVYSSAEGGGKIMYRMIHATDHKDAPKLMERAYRSTVNFSEPKEQLNFQFGI